ncbi:MAG TPA: transporter substrate-binding protein, partial [Methyloceanibacter sp.]|nr:transporter substrate-binding protein [Methyloceanibacter sp.]
LKSYLNAQGVADEDVAEFYTPFNHKDWEEVVGWIRRFGASGDAAIVTTMSGDANIYFYRELGRQGITAESIPAMTLSIGEGELPAIAGPEMAGHLAAWSYLHEIDSPENKAFVSAWRRFCNAPNVVTDYPMEATWIGFNLWKEAVSLEGSVDVSEVRRALGGLRIKAPSGFEVVMDLSNHHLHKPAVIGRITADARIVPIWISQGLIAPNPWNPWLERYEPAPRTAPRGARELALAS